jgi:hypothetical protein
MKAMCTYIDKPNTYEPNICSYMCTQSELDGREWVVWFIWGNFLPINETLYISYIKIIHIWNAFEICRYTF